MTKSPVDPGVQPVSYIDFIVDVDSPVEIVVNDHIKVLVITGCCE